MTAIPKLNFREAHPSQGLRTSEQRRPERRSARPEIRDARPVDVPRIAEFLLMAGRGHLQRGPWDLAFPDDVDRMHVLHRIAGGDPPSWGHYSVYVVAEVEGAAAAGLVAFDPREVPEASLGIGMLTAIAEFGWPPERAEAVGPLLAPYVRCFPDMPESTWIVENVATRPEARRRGLVRALLEHALERGRARGHRTAQISCLIGNEPAERAYERVGFRVVERRVDAEFEALMGAPGFSRMTLSL